MAHTWFNSDLINRNELEIRHERVTALIEASIAHSKVQFVDVLKVTHCQVKTIFVNGHERCHYIRRAKVLPGLRIDKYIRANTVAGGYIWIILPNVERLNYRR